jgi:hypothetical protein
MKTDFCGDIPPGWFADQLPAAAAGEGNTRYYRRYLLEKFASRCILWKDGRVEFIYIKKEVLSCSVLLSPATFIMEKMLWKR